MRKIALLGLSLLVIAQSSAADKVRGFLPNTRLFDTMLSAFGWKRDK